MANNIKAVAWAMRYHKVVFLVTALLLLAGNWWASLYAQTGISNCKYKSDYCGNIPRANSEQVAKQLTKPLEEHLFKYKEVKRKGYLFTV